MRPVKLIMSAFGSYGGVETIEFDKMQNGLFLIAGDTGSGKSTIFDAVMFALYDTMSGRERKSIMMRSEYAPEDRETFVEFTFSYGKSVYTVKRYPPYERKSKRRNKDGIYSITRQQGKVSLTMPDGVQFNGKTAQINKKIEEITGLTAEQFNKIALIAQGEFQELVMDRTGRRKEIFRQIFSTQVYADIEDAISRRYKAEAVKMKDNSIRLGELFNSADIQEDSPYKEEWKAAFEKKDTEPERLINVLQDEMLRLKDIYSSQYSLYKKKEKEYNGLNLQITKAKDKNKLVLRLEKLEAVKEKLDSLKEDMDNKENILSLAKRAAQVLFAETNYNNRKEDYNRAIKKSETLRLKEKSLRQQYDKAAMDYKQADEEYRQLMPGYITKRDNLKQAVLKCQTVSDREKELAALNVSFKKAVSDREKELKKLEKTTQDIAAFENIIKSCENLGIEMEQTEAALKKCDAEWLLLGKLKKRRAVCGEKRESLELIGKELLSCVAKWEKSRRKHEDYNRMYIACQSAFLAEELVPGKPCPVCGAKEHPETAKRPDGAVTQDMLERAAKAEKKAEVCKNDTQKKAEAVQSALAADTAVLNEYIAQLSGGTEADGQVQSFAGKDFTDSFAQFVDKFIQEKEDLVSADKSSISEKIKELEARAADREQRRKELEKANQRRDKAVSSIEAREQQIYQLELKTEGLKKEIETLKASIGYNTKEEAEKNFQECEMQLDALEKKYKNTDTAFKDIQKQLNSVQGSLKEAERQAEEYSYSLGELLKIFEDTFKENGFESMSGYKSAVISEKAMQQLDDEIKGYRQECVKAGTGIQTILEQLDDTSKINLDELNQQLAEVSDSLSVIKSGLDTCNFRIQSNNKTMERVFALMQERGTIAERLKTIKSLNEAANGKVHFQTYIQRQYFKQIIQAANTRLSGMAQGKFLLKCRDIGTGGQGETGLELDVYNPLTGKSRDAHTLSGGETFMASLSMALGMADIVQNTVGKTKLDTMFIDEGFGSLSDDVRNKAVSVLLELAGSNRLVGVISHVSELKEQIPDKLVVTKGNNGSSVKWERD